jgi:hypothetical protein
MFPLLATVVAHSIASQRDHLRYVNVSPREPIQHRRFLPPIKLGDEMSDHETETAKVPLMQQLLDNPFLLLFLGVLIPMVVYTLWGVIDILTIPLAK